MRYVFTIEEVRWGKSFSLVQPWSNDGKRSSLEPSLLGIRGILKRFETYSPLWTEPAVKLFNINLRVSFLSICWFHTRIATAFPSRTLWAAWSELIVWQWSSGHCRILSAMFFHVPESANYKQESCLRFHAPLFTENYTSLTIKSDSATSALTIVNWYLGLVMRSWNELTPGLWNVSDMYDVRHVE